MEWQFIVALVVMIPVIMLPVAFVWYLNLGGILAAVRRARATERARQAAERTKAI
jgi:Tfp pilus assembly protein PilO